MTISGNNEESLGKMILECVKNGLTFNSMLRSDGTWVITLTGGY